MSHLPLDARAILHYLNELGYRNITAEQLREFLKGMQPQPDQNKSKHATTTATAKATILHQKQQQQQQQHQQQAQIEQKHVVSTAVTKSTPPTKKLKILKSKRPLSNFKFYLDICDNQLTKRIEEQVKTLGGTIEFFLTDSVTHFITDKTALPLLVGGGGGVGIGSNKSSNNNQSYSHPNTPQTPATPNTPQTPCATALEANDARFASCATPIGTARKTRQSRADEILNRARRQSNNVIGTTTTTTVAATIPKSTAVAGLANTRHQSNTATTSAAGATEPLPTYKIWQTEQALLFFKKVETELRDYLNSASSYKARGNSHAHVISFKGSFIKVEAIKHSYRPYYHIFKKPDGWPKIDLSSDDGAFRLQERHKPALITADAVAQQQVMTRKSRTRTSQQNQQHKQTALTVGISNRDEAQPITPLPAAIQVLKQQERYKSNNTTAATTPNTPNCREAKESSDKQCGVCEICKIEYDTLTIHLKTKDHEYFSKNPENFIALDTLIQSTADVNKFLSTENIQQQQQRHVDDVTVISAAELEEMEVDESLCNADENVRDPLEDVSISPNPNGSDLSKRRPSPALREKSKRSTKGKHSSEKFQSKRTTTTIPKQSSTKSCSPKKRAAATSIVEAKRIENPAIVTVIAPQTPKTTRRKVITQNVTLSPPIRAMLPPSSMYKVVEPAEVCTTAIARSRRGNTGIDNIEPAATASPSIIVKFQKVRQNELQRLNGEAESFMFPKTRSSSELPTDVDRQTTSDRARVSMSSTSLDSTSGSDVTLPTTTQDSNSAGDGVERRKIAIAKRSKGTVVSAGATSTKRKLSTGSNSSTSRQRFPSAPIQPETQLRVPAKTAHITLPEATRKSSRTATAIVSKATISSRLLRAQVEAAKLTNRRQQQSEAKTMPTPAKVNVTTPMSSKRNNKAVEKLEDRMGENSMTQRSKRKVKTKINLAEQTYVSVEDDGADDVVDNVNNKFSDDDRADDDVDDEEEYENDNDDDENDKDYVASKPRKCPITSTPATLPRINSRNERAARRLTRLSLPKVLKVEEDKLMTPMSVKVYPKLGNVTSGIRERAASKKQGKPNTPASSGLASKVKQQQQTVTTPYIFDYTKSEHVSKLNYAFESLPATDLWYHVYMRQDAGRERFHSYFGSTNYRKLPYELGPISLNSTLNLQNNCCTLCQGEALKKGLMVKEELPVATKRVATSNSEPSVEVALGIKQEPTKSSSYRHKKLHLLERYQQEQQALLEQEYKKKVSTQVEDIAARVDCKMALGLASSTAITKCDSKASTPELFDREFASLNVNELNTVAEQARSCSTHSNASSSCVSQSSTASQSKKHHQFRHKQLNRIVELPPRKSPREHASTLALVSCIIRQRQDSLSRNNSEVDEPPTTPTPSATPTPLPANSVFKLEEMELKPDEIVAESKPPILTQSMKTPKKCQSPSPIEKSSINSPRTTRSAAVTPIEELRFATEISENVKRMRRGQNKYDHSPPVVPRLARGRGRPPQISLPLANTKTSGSTLPRRLVLASKQELTASAMLGKRQRRVKVPPTLKASKQRVAYSTCFGNSQAATSALTNTANGVVNLPGVRKIGTKKGVLEYEFDANAMKVMSKPNPCTNSSFDAWLIDKYLEVAGREYDMEVAQMNAATTTDYVVNDVRNAAIVTGHTSTAAARIAELKTEIERANTPPPTDCFTSDFDLFDLLSVGATAAGGGSGDDDDTATASRRNSFCFYSSTTTLQSYYRKRKSLKSNRTGWPKIQKRKTSARQQKLHEDRINFQKIGIGRDMPVQIKEEPMELVAVGDDEDTQESAEKVQTKDLDNDINIVDVRRSVTRNSGCGDGVITPPATDDDEHVDVGATVDMDNNMELDEIFEDVGGGVGVGDESILDDDETMADSVELEEDDDEEEENAPEAEIEATDADIEEDGDDDDDDDDDEQDQEDDDDNDDSEQAEDDEEEVEEDDDEFEDAYDHDANDTDVFDDTRTGETIKTQQAAAVQEVDDELCASEEYVESINKHVSRSHDKHEAEENEDEEEESLVREQHSPNKVLIALLNAKSSAPATTSTPATTPTMLRQQLQQHQQQSHRRTPQLNGSLGSCISPTEKLCDTSDIFTVSSDGLDTDLDLSNPHTQLKPTDSTETELQPTTHHCPHQTPKHLRKLIKHEERLNTVAATSENGNKVNYFDDLHKRATVSSRAKGTMVADKSGAIADNRENCEVGPSSSAEIAKSRQSPTSANSKGERMNAGRQIDALTQAFRENLLLEQRVVNDDGVTKTKDRHSRSRSRRSTAGQKSVERGARSSSSSSAASASRLRAAKQHNRRRTSKKRTNSVGASGSRTIDKPPSQSILLRRQRSRPRKKRGGDPVELFQYYKNEWEHFRKQIPGESAHAQLRWQIRYKLLESK